MPVNRLVELYSRSYISTSGTVLLEFSFFRLVELGFALCSGLAKAEEVAEQNGLYAGSGFSCRGQFLGHIDT